MEGFRHLRKIGELEMKPYLLRHLDINHPNHVWSIDITYIPMMKGFMYNFGIYGAT